MHGSRLFAFGLFLFSLSWLGYDHYRPWLNFHSEMLAFAGVFILMASALGLRRPHSLVPRVAVWLALLVLLPWLQYLWGVNAFAGDALMSSLYLAGLLAAVFVGYSFGLTRADSPEGGVLWFMHSLWVMALVSGAIGMAQWFNVQGPLQMYVVQSDLGDRAMGNLGQANQLATLLLLGIAALACVYERKVIGDLAFFTGAGFMSGVLVLTQSRSGLLSVIVVAIFLVWKKRHVSLRLSNWAILTWVVALVVGNLLLPSLSELLLMQEARSLGTTSTFSLRLTMWKQVGAAVLQSPWLGYGWNQTPSAHAAGAIAYPGTFTYTFAHNFLVDMLAWNGIPLGLLLSGAIAYWFITRMSSSKRIEAVYALACLLPVAVHSMLEFPFAYAYFLLTCGLMVGIVEAVSPARTTVSVRNRWAWCFLTVWLSLGSYIVYEYFLIEEDFRVVRFENLRIGQTPPSYDIPHVWMLSHMGAMLKAGRQVAKPNMSSEELENLRTVSARFAYSALNFRYAQALGLNGDPQGAKRQLAIIKGMYGDYYYDACIAEIRHLQAVKYPQFSEILPPQ